MSSVQISKLSVEHYSSPLGISHVRPRLTWRFSGDAVDWIQTSYSYLIRYQGGTDYEAHNVQSSASVLVPWPGRNLLARERVDVKVQAHGGDNRSTGWAAIQLEVALLDKADWSATLIGGPEQPPELPHRPIFLRKTFTVPHNSGSETSPARLYITAHGCYKVFLNGKLVSDDALMPGWQSYHHRLHYQVFDVTRLLMIEGGENTIGVLLGEGWYATRLNFGGGIRNIWGSDLAMLLQLELGGEVMVQSGADGWTWANGPIISSEIYDGERYDGREERPLWATSVDTSIGWSSDVRKLGFPRGNLIPAECPPVRRTQTILPKEIITTPSGKTVVDFGQNLVGWLKFTRHPSQAKVGDVIEIRHAEELERSEVCLRPLRNARASSTVIVGEQSLEGYEPSFTFYGFRYVQVDGWHGFDKDSVTAQVVHTDMERIGWFHCNHAMIQQVWENANWGLRGNFVSVPTDCPQRDERLGWTGDLQTFAETASYLFDTSSTLGCWLQDLAAEQLKEWDGVVPLVVPNTLGKLVGAPPPFAIWGDASALTPYDLYLASGDTGILQRQYESMAAWLDRGVKRSGAELWDPTAGQLSDWLDPQAPPDMPEDGRTDAILVADAYLVRTTETVAKIAALVGQDVDALRYAQDTKALRLQFQKEYMSPNGRLVSDTQTAIALALQFDLIPPPLVSVSQHRLDTLVRKAVFRIATGFAGTPFILHALSDNGLLQHAYRMFQEKQCPAILYPVSMGATTIVSSDESKKSRAYTELFVFAQWERWDSKLPDGSINPGEMTSFNHYALGSIVSWLHKVVGGVEPLSAGWQNTRFRPRPGGTITSAATTHISPYGEISCQWDLDGDDLNVTIKVPPNCTGQVELPGIAEKIGSGTKVYSVKWAPEAEWPPKSLQVPFNPPKPDEPV